MFSNDWRFLPAFLGPMRIGAVSVPLNIRMGDEALAYVVQDAEATVLVAGRDQAERARRLANQVKGLAHLVVDAPAGDGGLQWDVWLAAASPRFRRRRLDPESVCMQPYTSGSTGKPKGVLLAHRGQVWNADIIRKMACIDDTERALVAVPLYHKNAMIGAVKPFLLAAARWSSFSRSGRGDRTIDRHQVTYLTGVPAMYKLMLAETDTLARHSVRTIRYALCGSAEVPEELLVEFQRVFGAPIGESYGLTEGGPVPMANPATG
jgi:acyl-CoA synthetase (AMP-forming)/AMP-acid ligase II